jgi:hypothetical protein
MVGRMEAADRVERERALRRLRREIKALRRDGRAETETETDEATDDSWLGGATQ